MVTFETLIQLDSGAKIILDVEPGEYIASYDFLKKEIVYNKVLQKVMALSVDGLCTTSFILDRNLNFTKDLVIYSGSAGLEQNLHKKLKWDTVKYLHDGNLEVIPIVDFFCNVQNNSSMVYSLKVDRCNNYFANGILVKGV